MEVLIIVLFLVGFCSALIKSLIQDYKNAMDKKETDKYDRELLQYERDRKRKEIKQFYNSQDLKELDKLERLETIENATIWIDNELKCETDPKKRILLHKELERLQKQHYITKYKE